MWKAATYFVKSRHFAAMPCRLFAADPSAVLQKILGLVKAVQGVAEDKVVPTATLKDLNVDSLAIIEMFSTLETEFNVSIGEDDAEEVKTLQDLANIVIKRSQ